MFQAVRSYGECNPDGTARPRAIGQELPGENHEQDGAKREGFRESGLLRAEAAENNNAIYLDDDNAVEKLERKLAELVKAQEDMKAANKVVKNKKLTEEEKKVRLVEMGYSGKSAVELLTPCYGHIGFPSFSLSNNNANINRIKKRLELAKRMKGTPEKEYTINGVRVVENYPENRLQVFFDDIPAKEIRDSLKQHGFHQRHMEEKKEEPEYAVCVVVWKDDNNSELVNIRLSSDSNLDKDDDIFFYCNGLSGLKSLCEFGGEDFIVTEIHYLEKCCNG